MKRILVLILVFSLVLPSIAGAATFDLSKYSNEELNSLAAAVVAEQQSRSKSQTGYLLSGQFGDSFIGLKNVLLQANSGKNIVVLVYDFSHQSDESKSFMWISANKVFQDGIQCDTAFFYDHPSSGNSIKEIKKGATIEVVEAYEVKSSSPIEIEIDEMFSLGDSKPLTLTMNLP